MQTTNASEEKRTALEHLNYGAKTAVRVGCAAWEFTVSGTDKLAVTNASYGYLKDDHSYTVTIDDVNGVAIPETCECPADQFNDDYDCKHKVALASIGGPTVLSAALDGGGRALSRTTLDTPIRQPTTDSGIRGSSSPEETNGCPHNRAGCNGPESDKLGCFDCYT